MNINYRERGYQLPFVSCQARWKFYALKMGVAGYLFVLFIAACSPKLQLSSSEKALYPISAEQPKDQKIMEYYLPYKVRLDSLMKEVIAFSDIAIVKGRPEGPLNNLMAGRSCCKVCPHQ